MSSTRAKIDGPEASHPIDLFVVRTISFKLLYGLVTVHCGRRRLAMLGSVLTTRTRESVQAVGTSHYDR